MKSERGRAFVVAAPSGTGKTTVCHAVLSRDERIRFSVSHTTRAPREGERDGIDYHFVGEREFRKSVEAGEFVEHAEYAGRLYGTSWRSLETPLEEGCDLLVEIEVQGARQLRERLADAVFVFLLPPSMAVLEARLRGRGTDEDAAVERRLAVADRELEAVHFFDYAIVNDELDDAVEAMLEIIDAERRERCEGVRQRFGRAAVYDAWQARNRISPER